MVTGLRHVSRGHVVQLERFYKAILGTVGAVDKAKLSGRDLLLVVVKVLNHHAASRSRS